MANELRRQEIIASLEFDAPSAADLWIERLRQGLCPVCGTDPEVSDLTDHLEQFEFDRSHVCGPCQRDIYSLRHVSPKQREDDAA